MESQVKATVRLGLCSMLFSLAATGATCASLATASLPNTSIISAQSVAAGTFQPGAAVPAPAISAIYKSLPSFCRVSGVVQSGNDSRIEFEVWLPSVGWNGKYMGIGNPGFAGSIFYASPPGSDYPGLANALLGGYAASATDAGHKGRTFEAQWALGHPEKIIDYGYRAIHQTAEKSKEIIRIFYDQNPKHSYFDSCSNGGREALMEAQRFPSDYDGIIAGAPANALTHIVAAFIGNIQATEAHPASYISPAKLPALEAAALAACDSLDGLKDGIIDDPRKCHFDPAVLLCKGAESDLCLTKPQTDALRKIYAGARKPGGEQVYPGYYPGGETGTSGWAAWITGSAPGKAFQFAFGTQAGAFMLFQNPSWDYRAFNVESDLKMMDDKLRHSLNATDPNLKAFSKTGGKLILYHGWSDPALAPASSVEYYESVVATMGRKDAESFTRLFMVPGMQHCGGGPGPNTFGGPLINALESWVEQGKAPDKLLATRYNTDGDPSSGVARTRPLCPYPQVARYRGRGSIDDAANFECRVQ